MVTIYAPSVPFAIKCISVVQVMWVYTTRGGDLVREETCLENFIAPNSGAIFPITFNDCGAIFPTLFFWTSSSKFVPCAGGGGGMIGGGVCGMKHLMWMDGLVKSVSSAWLL